MSYERPPPKNFPAIRHRDDLKDGDGTLIEVWYSADDRRGPFCGDRLCHGDCGFPALVIPVDDGGMLRYLKARNSFGAVCNVFCQWDHWDDHKSWPNPISIVPEEHREALRTLIWW